MLVRYDFVYSQLGTTRLVGHLPSHIQSAFHQLITNSYLYLPRTGLGWENSHIKFHFCFALVLATCACGCCTLVRRGGVTNILMGGKPVTRPRLRSGAIRTRPGTPFSGCWFSCNISLSLNFRSFRTAFLRSRILQQYQNGLTHELR